ncbi:hypothetical protein GCM10018772_48800 [Streptomyces fumanus]|uniref:Uncharacterized protein n=1 Tax=Streptomyces fumanus TaxID=67302 RepID=A0A919E6G0_9ACTN|nr:hypothetical protein GCM10018772_48800 [Streptomyces fumanus]
MNRGLCGGGGGGDGEQGGEGGEGGDEGAERGRESCHVPCIYQEPLPSRKYLSRAVTGWEGRVNVS